MARAAKFPNGDVVLLLTAYEADKLLAAVSFGRDEAAEQMDGRGAGALKRSADALAGAARRATGFIFAQGVEEDDDL